MAAGKRLLTAASKPMLFYKPTMMHIFISGSLIEYAIVVCVQTPCRMLQGFSKMCCSFANDNDCDFHD